VTNLSFPVHESFLYREKSPNCGALSSQFNFIQASFANRVKSRRVIDELIQKTSIEAFIEDVIVVEKRLDNGLISELRQLELELIYAGKVSFDITFSRIKTD
jgi:hypothetical protein